MERARGYVMWAMPWPGWPGPDPRGTCLLALAPRRPSAELGPRALSLPTQPLLRPGRCQASTGGVPSVRQCCVCFCTPVCCRSDTNTATEHLEKTEEKNKQPGTSRAALVGIFTTGPSP